MTKPHTMNSTIDWDLLLNVKKYLDNGFNGEQTAKETGMSTCVVSNVRNGKYGPMPKFEKDPELNKRLRQVNLDKINHTLHLRRERSANKK